MSIDDFAGVLNKEQFEAVTYGDGPLLVLAGAGSGKTRVLTYRYAYLVDVKNVRPYNILAITFTNKAAMEMKTRISDLLGSQVETAWIGTFHACCGRILRRHAEVLGYDAHFTIYAEAESLETVKSAIKALDLDEKRYPPRLLRSIIGQYKNRMISPDEAMAEADSFLAREYVNIYRKYQSILHSSNCMDFDDMILNVIKLWEENPEILDYYRELFRYVLVDEYQDTNKAQHRLVYLLTGEDGNLCVVGDDDQSIYSFRGAEVDNILDFEATHRGTRTVKLEQNYRSTENILNVANDIIKLNPRRTGKRLWTRAGKGDRPVCYSAGDNNEEADFICSEIARGVAEGTTSYSDYAVLYRVNAVSTAIERVLTRMRIPYRIYGGMKFYDRKEIKDLVAYLRILANPHDEASLRRIINVPKRGIGDTTVERISQLASDSGRSMLEVIRDVDNCPSLFRAAEKLKSFAGLIDGLAGSLADSETLTGFVEDVIDKTGLAREYENDHTPESDAKVENIKEFLSVTKTFEDGLDEAYESAGAVFSEFLETVSLNSDLETAVDEGGDGSKVTLSTIHSAKGLEFPVVFVAGLEEGVFPSFQSIDEPKQLDEERRLMYVAVTRAMKKLYLTSSEYRMIYGKTQSYMKSRFLRDIPEGDLERKGKGRSSGSGRGARYSFDFEGDRSSRSSFDFEASRSSRSSFDFDFDYDDAYDRQRAKRKSEGSADRPSFGRSYTDILSGLKGPRTSGTSGASSTAANAANKTYLKSVAEGERVKHKKFGEGTVSSVQESGNGTIVEIVFDGCGMKRLVLEYAKLEAPD